MKKFYGKNFKKEKNSGKINKKKKRILYCLIYSRKVNYLQQGMKSILN